MTENYCKEELFRILSGWSDFESKEIIEEGAAYNVALSNGAKKVEITTPYELAEFFLTFYERNEPIYSDWYEAMGEPLEEFMDYTKQVATRFLNQQVRVQQKGWCFFKSHQFQYNDHGVWRNVL